MTDIEKLIKLLEHAESFSLEAYGKSPNLSECSLNIQYLRACILQAIGNAKALRERLANDKTDREIMQQALNDLEALVAYIKGGEPDLFMQVPSIEALRERLAQPEQEPVSGVVIREGLPTLLQDKHIKSTDQRLYTAPPEQGQLEWQGLTKEEMQKLADTHLVHQLESYEVSGVFDLIRAVEAKLKETK